MNEKEQCPICDGTYDVDRTQFICDEHEECLDDWVVTECKLCGCTTISPFKLICVKCLNDEEQNVSGFWNRYDDLGERLIVIPSTDRPQYSEL